MFTVFIAVFHLHISTTFTISIVDISNRFYPEDVKSFN